MSKALGATLVVLMIALDGETVPEVGANALVANGRSIATGGPDDPALTAIVV